MRLSPRLPLERGAQAVVSERAPAELRVAAEELARAAGEVVRAGWGARHAPERKGRIDLVTEYDRRSESLLLERIAARFPGDAVLAEESGARAPATGATVRWIVDPLDGTTNFAHNYPFFAVSVGVERRGELVAGAVHDPVRGETFSAAAGAGATLNGRSIHVSAIDALEDALLVTGFPYDVREHPERHVPLFQDFLLRAQGIRRDGSAALNLCYLAMGRFDGFWEGNLSPWDVAAGSLIVREAGGTLSDYRGGAFRIDGRQICAGPARLHARLLEVIARHPESLLVGGA